MIEIGRVGGRATLQDLGRPGFADLGVGRSGAADRGALRLANRLVGNDPGCAAIEVTLGGLTFTAITALTLALTGAPGPAAVGWGAAVTIAAGTMVEIGPPTTGLHRYLAVRGGLDVAPVLGSRSTDALSGLGPPPLRPGDRIAIGRGASGPVSGEPAAPGPRPSTLRIVRGPRDAWFDPTALVALTTQAWTVRPDSNRIGVRLEGIPLIRVHSGELATEPTLPGALQLPADGRPILLGPDAPVTGGYPVIAVVVDADLDAAGQLRPGDEVWFSLAER
jgi:biotin-dependent carboxylase-like uncharacterized protein